MRIKSEDTIAAVATPMGVGGVGIIRLSGAAALGIAQGLFRASGRRALGQAPSHQMLHGWIETEGVTLDEVLAVYMRAPHSYTGEDVVELHGHGGAMVLQTLLEAVCRAGARLAEPGEFTMRAFFNGRMDLTRVEAVSDIVNAGSALGLQVSANQLRGRLYEAILALKEDVAHVAALVAAGIDFPEEDVVFSHRDDIVGRLRGVAAALGEMVARAGQGRLLREGLAVAIVGRPNVGKSSLLNALLRENRAIVTDIPGTTRDTLEETAQFGGLLLRLIDTAGIRATEDPVEREGVRRSEKAMAQADLVLLLLDGSAPLTEEDRRLLDESPGARTLLVVNKRDRMTGDAPAWAEELRHRTWVAISALTGEGLAAMEQQVRHLAFEEERPQLEHVLITNLRQQQAAQQALEAVEQALRGVDEQVGDELLAIDVGRALDALGDIVGETTADDLLNRIFAEFCIGK